MDRMLQLSEKVASPTTRNVGFFHHLEIMSSPRLLTAVKATADFLGAFFSQSSSPTAQSAGTHF